MGLLLLNCQHKTNIHLETFSTETGWGYVLKKNDHIFIKQETIPAIPGNQTFSSEADARKVGILTMKKIKSGEGPSVTSAELDSLKIVYHPFH